MVDQVRNNPSQILLDRTLKAALFPLNPRSKLLIFTYHRVLKHKDPLLLDDVDAETFEWQISMLKRLFNIIPLSEAVAKLQQGKLPPMAASITFDDGYLDNYDVAFPILKKWGAPATFFIATGFINGGRMWNDTVIEAIRTAPLGDLDLSSIGLGIYNVENEVAKEHSIKQILNQLKYLSYEDRLTKVDKIAGVIGANLPNNLMMNSSHVKALSDSGMEIGAHTVSHPILAKIPIESAKREILDSQKFLCDLVGKSIKSFAFPNGKPDVDYNREHLNILQQAGFDCSVSTAWGCALRHTDVFQMPRISIWDNNFFRIWLRTLQCYLAGQGDRV